MPSLTDLPLDLLIDDLLPHVPLESIASLCATCKYLATACDDDTFWKRKLREDYNFPHSLKARTKGFKFFYKGVKNSKCYVWGLNDDNRLGLQYPPYERRGILSQSVPYPVQLTIAGPRIVSLVASGWAFHALDSEGSIHVCGRVNGDVFSSLPEPVKLKLPERISVISGGRGHTTALSERKRVWIFTSWSHPYVLTSPLLSASTPLNTPYQIESGWGFSVILLQSGEVYVWWPYEGEVIELANARIHGSHMYREHGVMECQAWEVTIDPLPILDLPENLPHLRGVDELVGNRIIKVAAGDNFIIALTEAGHVLKVDFFGGIEDFRRRSQPLRWEYLQAFSESQCIGTMPYFQGIAIPAFFKITHVSAHFLTFFAYTTGSSSIVLKGSKETDPHSPPEIIPSLQNNDIISVVLGDYHFGALSSTGKLLTWGAYSKGALGLGDPTQLPIGSPGGFNNPAHKTRARLEGTPSPPAVAQPTEVKFGTTTRDRGRDVFVFHVAASGWQTGALVIDMEVGHERSFTYAAAY